MANFDIGETVICSCEVKDDAGAYKDPATSMTIEILGVLTETTMTKDAVGKYHYDFQTSGKNKGKYTVVYKATDGSRITIGKDSFELQ